MQLPTAKEINVYDSLDEKEACKHFLGKNLDEAEALFRENAAYYQEDLMWMGAVAFRYYVQAAIRYIESEAAIGDSGIINFFAELLEFRVEHEVKELAPVADQLATACRYIIEHFDRFDLTPENYGDVQARLVALRQAFSQLL